MSAYEISKSSLLSLKAEILRKQEELSKTRLENETKLRNLKKNAPLEIKNKGLENRQINDITEEEQDLLKKSKSILEAKAQLYEKLSKKTNLTDDEIEYNRRYLVRFDRKQKQSKVPDLPPDDDDDDDNDIDRYPESDEDVIENNYEPPRNRDEEWVEYTDCLGRTRTCLRKDLEHVKSRDRDLKEIVDEKRSRGENPPPLPPQPPPKSPETKEVEITEENELLSNDMRAELLRKQWEKEEEELRNKTNIHYQDILFNEARTHGVGYYGFSKDEEERAKQQEALNKLRQETEQQQKRAQELKAIREKQLAARVRAAKNRRLARLGLPPEEEPEPVVAPEPEKVEVKEDDEKEKEREKLRKTHVRPWDLGKEGVSKHYEYTQEEWVDKRRKERPNEFAPPSSYRKENSSKSSRRHDKYDRKDKKEPLHKFDVQQPTPIINECSDEDDDDDRREVEKRGRGAEYAPPPSMDYYNSSSVKRRKTEKSVNVGDSIEAGLKYLREQIEKRSGGNSRRDEDIFID